jgi:hypothetical protein
MSEQPPPGRVASLVDMVKGLSLANVLVIALLVMLAIPSYILYRLFNDQAMLGRVLSSYEEITSDKTPCTLRIASLRGAGDTYSISTGFAYQGSDKWVVSVIMEGRKPTDEEFNSYCEALQLLVDFMRDPDAHPPPEPRIQMYPNGQ